jgi:hypothetical protein
MCEAEFLKVILLQYYLVLMFVAPVFSLGLQLPLWLSPQITENNLTSKEMGSCILNLKHVDFQSFERSFKNSSK